MAYLPNTEPRDVLEFPDMENISEEKKQEPEYNLNVAQKIYTMYRKDQTEIGAGLDTFIDELRLYAKGKQDPNQYKTANSGFSGGSSFDPTTGIDSTVSANRETSLKGWKNVSWDIVSPLPNVVRAIKGHFMGVDYDVKAHNIDIDSTVEEDKRMREMWNKSPQNFGIMINAARQAMGLPQKQPDYIPTSYYELEELKKEGTFKAEYIRQQEKVLLHTENISNWDRSLKEKTVEDLITVGYAFAYSEYDKETCKIKYKYADLKDVAMQYSKETDFDDVDWAGLFTYPTISNLRQVKDWIVNVKTGEKITEKDLKEIAGKYIDYMDNVDEAEWNHGLKEEIKESVSEYNGFKVCVLKTWWIDVDNDKKIEYTKVNGKKRYYPYSEETAEKYSGKRVKVKNVRSRKLYQCNWIVGTDFIYDFGLMPNQPRPTHTRPKIPLVGVKLGEKSIVHTLKEVCDNYQIAWLRIQNILSKAAQNGYAVNISQLVNISDGNKSFDPLKIVQMWREEGLIFYESYNNGVGIGGDPIPIHLVEGGLGQMMQEEIFVMNNAIAMIEVLTGISPIALGATPSDDAPVGTSQMSFKSTINSLQTIVTKVKILKEELARVASPMAQLTIKNSPKAAQEYAKVIGKEGVAVLKTAKNLGVQYGIELVSRPTDEEWMELITSARDSMNKRSPGVPGINHGQFAWMLDQRKKGGNFGEVAIKFNAWIKQDEERVRKEKNENITLQGQQNKELEQIKAQSVQQTNQSELAKEIKKVGTELDADVIRRQKESDLIIREQDNEYRNKERLLRLEKELEGENNKEEIKLEAKLEPKSDDKAKTTSKSTKK